MNAAARPWRRALLWLVLLGPLFFLSYGYANSIAAQRVDVGSVVFDWEHAIPFWAWTIVPYWTIDAFYAVSLFACRDRRELDTHALRLLTAQLIAVSCFLLWPLTFTFARPETQGVFGWMFDVLLGFDKPFNQAPSLHIVLLIVLWVRFAQHLGPRMRGVLHVWFALIGVSVLTTYQHHFIDIPTGVLAGWLCVWLCPERATPPWRGMAWARDPARWRLAGYYGVGAMACTLLAWQLRGVALWLLWPATSLLLVALNYALLGANGFQKRSDGRLSLAAQWLSAPYLAGAWLNSRAWTRRAPQSVMVADEVWLGRLPGGGEAAEFAAIVDVCAELSLPRDARVVVSVQPMLDLVAPSRRRCARWRSISKMRVVMVACWCAVPWVIRAARRQCARGCCTRGVRPIWMQRSRVCVRPGRRSSCTKHIDARCRRRFLPVQRPKSRWRRHEQRF